LAYVLKQFGAGAETWHAMNVALTGCHASFIAMWIDSLRPFRPRVLVRVG
jgi:hypothetical protein